MKIIVADDVASRRPSISALLRRAGPEWILCARGGHVLVTRWQSDTACVVSDVQIPNFDDLAVSRAIPGTDYERHVDIRLITATGYRRLPAYAHGERAQPTGYALNSPMNCDRG
jgi:CheY-like chemotaxis protein